MHPPSTSPSQSLARLTLGLCVALGLTTAATDIGAQTSKPTKGAATKASRPGAATALIQQARELLAQGQAAQALSLARRASQLEPRNYRPHYYLAFAQMELGELESAQGSIRTSEQLASSEAERQAVSKLSRQIDGQWARTQAEQAKAEGLKAKAHRLYAEAWGLGALSAAETLTAAADRAGDRDADYLVTARMLDGVLNSNGDPKLIESAKKVASQWSWRRSSQASIRLDEALKRGPQDPDRARLLAESVELTPTLKLASLTLVNDAAQHGDWPTLQAGLKALLSAKLLDGALRDRQLALAKWQQQPDLKRLLSDIYGDDSAARLLVANDQNEVLLLRPPATVRIPRGSFEMGSRQAKPGEYWISRDEERPAHSVQIDYEFDMGKTEFSNGEWLAYLDMMGKTPGADISKPGAGKYPVQVSWLEASTYARILSLLTAQTWRLPSEAEWEYAARAGSTGPFHTGAMIKAGEHANFKPWGNRRGPLEHFSLDERSSPNQVGYYPPNAFGLHEMLGNVAEWVADCYQPNYQGAPTDGSAWNSGKSVPLQCDKIDLKVVRGGDWRSHVINVRSAARIGLNWTSSRNGFRLVRELAP